MRDSPEIAAARIEADRARTRLIATAEQLQLRLSPKKLTKDAWEGAKDKGADLAEKGVDAVRSRPLATTGVIAAIGLFLAREPLMDLAGKIAHGFGSNKESGKRAKRSKRPKQDTETVE